MEKFISPEEISKGLEISKGMLIKMVKDKEFPSFYLLGSKKRWAKEDFEAWKIFFTKSALPLPKLDEKRLLEIKECAEKANQKNS